MPFHAVLFDLLTALLDSWSLWNAVAGSDEAGLRWRRAYLRLTYGAGAYRPYEDLVAEAARTVGLPDTCAADLVRRWPTLQPWDDAAPMLNRLAERMPLGVVTNCSEALARVAVERVGVPFAVVVSAERAGFYKPDPHPYQLARQELGASAAHTLFVAGSAFDIGGASGVGMPVFWHNRLGLPAPPDAPQPLIESRTLAPLLELVVPRV